MQGIRRGRQTVFNSFLWYFLSWSIHFSNTMVEGLRFSDPGTPVATTTWSGTLQALEPALRRVSPEQCLRLQSR